MPTRREILLEAVARWRADDVIDDATRDRIAAHVEADATLASDETARRSFAPDALRFVGGLFLGAAAVALTQVLELQEAAGAALLVSLAYLAAGAGAALQLRARRDGLAETAYAAAMVAAAVGGVLDRPWTAVPATLLAAGVLVLRRGRGPSFVAGSAAFAFASFGVTRVIADALGGGDMAWVWLSILLAGLALQLVWRREPWAEVALGLFVAPLAGSFVWGLLDLGGTSPESGQLITGVFLLALLGVGAWLGSRGLTAGAAAGLVVDAVMFAFTVGGPMTALVLLVALGGLLAWQAEHVRRFFRAGPRAPGAP